MKLQLLSDLHMEMSGFALKESQSDAVILAGDINVGTQGLKWAIEEAQAHQKPIFYVAGNHEFYKQEYWSLIDEMRALAETQPLVHFMERDEVIIKGVRFLGTTLWTDYRSTGKADQAYNMKILQQALNDHFLIKFGEELFKPEHALALHGKAVAWLEQKLAEPFDGRTVVITHHGPSLKCEHPQFGNNTIGSGFISDLDHLVKKADIWCYGHTHCCVDTTVGKCRLLSNQKGYPGEVLPGLLPFQPGLLIEVPD
jgi:predicted phosphodiesterase